MLTGLSHRLRGHKLRHVRRHVTYPLHPGGIEAGRVDQLLVCSCGQTWLRALTNPWRNEWGWL